MQRAELRLVTDTEFKKFSTATSLQGVDLKPLKTL